MRSLRLRVEAEPLELPARMRELRAKMREADAFEQEHNLLVDFAKCVQVAREPRFAKARCHGVGAAIGEFFKPDADCRCVRDCRCQRRDALCHGLPIVGGNDLVGIDDAFKFGRVGRAMPELVKDGDDGRCVFCCHEDALEDVIGMPWRCGCYCNASADASASASESR